MQLFYSQFVEFAQTFMEFFIRKGANLRQNICMFLNFIMDGVNGVFQNGFCRIRTCCLAHLTLRRMILYIQKLINLFVCCKMIVRILYFRFLKDKICRRFIC